MQTNDRNIKINDVNVRFAHVIQLFYAFRCAEVNFYKKKTMKNNDIIVYVSFADEVQAKY